MTASHVDLAIALAIGDLPTAQRLFDDPQLDPATLNVWLKRHHLAGLVGAALADAGDNLVAPDEVGGFVQRHARFQREYNPTVLAATHRAASLLRRAGHSPILLKGVHYAQRFYGDLARRFLWDVDLLVQPDAREAAVARLLEQGYRLKSGGLFNTGFARGLSHAVPLMHGDLELDLHWQLRQRPGFRIDYAALWRECQSVDIGGEAIDVPSDDYTLLTLLLNAITDLESGHSKFKQFIDLHLALRAFDATLDWDRFFARRRVERLYSLCIRMLAMHQTLFAADATFGNLGQALATREQGRRALDRAAARALIEAPRQRLGNRWWAAALYPGGRFAYLLWWSLTVPLRYAVGRTI